MDIIHEIRNHLVWQVGSGSTVRVGIDNIVGGEKSYFLSDDLVQIFHSKGYYTLDHFCTY